MWGRGRFEAICALALAGAACDGEETRPLVCSNDADCAAGQVCHFGPAGKARQAVLPDPCLWLPPCVDASTCAPSEVCAPIREPGCHQSTCTPPCTATGCPPEFVCGADRVCHTRMCDESGAPPCSKRYRCDPLATTEYAHVGQIYGSPDAADLEDPDQAASRGCVLQPCSEPGGLTCRPDWRCDVDNARDASGCVAIPCTESHECSDDTAYICLPSEASKRGLGIDANGCIPRLCTETSLPLCELFQDGIDYGYCRTGGGGAGGASGRSGSGGVTGSNPYGVCME